jgi:mRNA interferase MazF
MVDSVKRFEIWNVGLNPTIGSEINKTRPCLIVSPNEANKHLNTVIIVPLTSKSKPYPTRLNCEFKGKEGQLVIDQIRSIDKTRLIEKLGIMDTKTCKELCLLLIDTFKY